MSKAKDVRDAINQQRAERYKCATCDTTPAMEDDIYCFYCRAYWDDVRAGCFEPSNDLNDAWARGEDVER